MIGRGAAFGPPVAAHHLVVAVPLFGGLVSSTALTLLVLPALYPLFASTRLARSSDDGSATGDDGATA
jgi:hypothetical protein